MKRHIGILLAWLLLFSTPAFAYGPVTLQDAATATGAGTVLTVADTFAYQTIQIVIAGTATVQCQGSLDNTTFETLGSVTATGSCFTEGAWKFIRANISACSACTVTAKAVLFQ